MSFGWDLPPGVSDSDFEPNDPKCASCGHLYSEHLEDAIYNSDGQIVSACGLCECEGFFEGDYDERYEDEY